MKIKINAFFLTEVFSLQTARAFVQLDRTFETQASAGECADSFSSCKRILSLRRIGAGSTRLLSLVALEVRVR